MDTDLSGPEAALLEAALIAAELAQDGERYSRYVLHVTDEHGNDIDPVPIVPAIRINNRYRRGLH